MMTLSVLKGYSPIASLFKCDFSYLWNIASAEILVNHCEWSRLYYDCVCFRYIF